MKENQTNLTLRQFIMKLKISVLIIFLSVSSLFASGIYSQSAKVSLDMQKCTLEQVMDEIERQSEFYFIFNQKQIDVNRLVDIKAEDKLITEVLPSLFAGTNVNYYVFDRKILLSTDPITMGVNVGIKSGVQQQTVTGKVSDNETGEPLPGVNVVVKGTTIGTITDIAGNYSLNVPDLNSVLVFSFIGYATQEIPLEGRTSLNVVLTSEKIGLEEVVVIGYGTRTKKDITTAISAISAEEITSRSSLTPELAMQGQISGVQVLGNQGDPFSRQKVRIRGINTWGISSPLYVIDGIPITEYGAGIESGGNDNIYDRGNINIMSMIDPNDIESISVLKDAAAAAIYGLRAGNGVILITTKKGRKEKTSVDYSMKFSVQNQYQHLNVLNTQDYADHFYKFYTSNGLPIATNKPLDAPFFHPDSSRYLGNNPTYDWQEAGKNKNALTQEYSVRVSGGTEKSDYSVSFGYTNQDAVRIFNNLERYSGAINVNSDVNKFIKTGINFRIAYEKGHQNTSVGSIADRAMYPPWQPIYDPNDVNGFARVIRGLKEDGTWDNSVLYGTMTRENFFGTNSMSYNKNSAKRTMGTAYVELSPLKDLKIKGNISIDNFNNEIHNYYQYMRSLFMYGGASPLAYPNSVGYYEERNTDNLNTIKEITATYTKSFGNHNLDLLLNGMAQTFYAKIYKGYTYYMTTKDPNLFNLVPPLQPSDIGVTTTQKLNALAGILFRGSYNYNRKYYIDITARRDGSSRFAPAIRWSVFPGIALAWRVTEEKFMHSLPWINDLKLRASWGSLGNQEVNDLAYLSTIGGASVYSWGYSPDGKTPVTSGATVTGMANERLTWEKTYTTNIGADFVLFNKLTGTIEYYTKLTDGILQTVQLPLSAGVVSNPVQNIAQVSNKGIELELRYSDNIGELRYSIGGHLSTVKNRVERMYKGIPLLGSGIQEGYPMFYIYGYQVGGMFQNRQEVEEFMANITDVNYQGKESLIDGGDLYFKDIRSAPVTDEEKTLGYSTTPDNKIDQFDQQMIGKTIPGYHYGINLSFDYKGFDFMVQGMGLGDVQKVNNIKKTFLNTGAHAVNQLEDIKNYWRPDNTNTSIPRLIFGDPAANTRMSNYWVENAGYFRLTNIQLGYSFDQSNFKALSNIFLNQGRFFVGCSNAFTLTGYTGLDPEDDYNPAPVVFYAGLTVKF